MTSCCPLSSPRPSWPRTESPCLRSAVLRPPPGQGTQPRSREGTPCGGRDQGQRPLSADQARLESKRRIMSRSQGFLRVPHFSAESLLKCPRAPRLSVKCLKVLPPSAEFPKVRPCVAESPRPSPRSPGRASGGRRRRVTAGPRRIIKPPLVSRLSRPDHPPP